MVAEIVRDPSGAAGLRLAVPRDGVVLERNAVEGMKMSAGDVLFRIADLSTIWCWRRCRNTISPMSSQAKWRRLGCADCRGGPSRGASP